MNQGKTKKFVNSYEKERDAQLHGARNTVFWPSGKQYTGEWREGKREGYGSHIYKNGDKYEGEWKLDKRHGFGSFYKLQPEAMRWTLVYGGEWADDKYDGFGTLHHFNGERYEGQFREGECSGFGIYYFENGDLYTGEWKNDQKCGKGILLLGNGNRYEGMWKDDEKHGPGIFYFVEKKRKLTGEWFEGSSKTGFYEDSGVTTEEQEHFLSDIIPKEVEERDMLMFQARNVSQQDAEGNDLGGQGPEAAATSDASRQTLENQMLGITEQPPIRPLPKLGLRNARLVVAKEIAKLGEAEQIM